LYQEVILDHNRHPRNFKEIQNPTQYSHGVNPLCGDDYHVYLVIDREGIIQDVGFKGAGCAISKSSTSMMTAMIKGKRVDEVKHLNEAFLEMMTQDPILKETKAKVGKLGIFEGVKEFPVRVKCATLAWQALKDALKDA
jgi:nitrogen fixation protein NifU and related proteins